MGEVPLYSLSTQVPEPLAPALNLIRTSMYDTYSDSMKITTRLDHVSHCKQHLVQIGRMDGPTECLS